MSTISHHELVAPAESADGARVNRLPAGSPLAPSYPSGIYPKLVKPTIDRLVALVVLICVAPVLLVSIIAVRLSLGPGVFFRQERVGRDGRRFTVIKLRTMAACRRRKDARYGGPERRVRHKHPDDPRLTHVGRFLRKWSVDELPQLVNILKGDMSLVGPRPELPFIVDRYTEVQHCRHYVKPGLTGLWQVSERGHGEMHEFVHVDLDYVRRISPLLDLQLILRTPLCMLGANKGF